jgi:NADPH:quinone reductase-like Zn-dependent oxidoreductase
VIAGVADETQVETARAAGANEVVVLTGSFAPSVAELTGGDGVNVVLDPLGSRLFDEAV